MDLKETLVGCEAKLVRMGTNLKDLSSESSQGGSLLYYCKIGGVLVEVLRRRVIAFILEDHSVSNVELLKRLKAKEQLGNGHSEPGE